MFNLKTNLKRLRFYGLIVGIAIFLILTTAEPSPAFVDCQADPLNIECILPTPSPEPTTDPSPTPTITPTPENSQFYDTPTNIEAAVIIMNASKRWGTIIYPAIYAVQIIGIILRYV